jgi:hypothetical protein
MAQLDLTQQQALLLTKILGGTLQHSGPLLELPEVSALYAALQALEFPIKACVVCGVVFDAKNPRRTTCSARCRQVLSRSKRAAPAHAAPDSHAEAVTPAPQPATPPAPPPEADPRPPSQPDRDSEDPVASLRDFIEGQRERVTAQWELCKADAKRHGFTAAQVQRFRQERRLGFESPLAPDAAQLLRHELEVKAVSDKGESLALEERLAHLRERATAPQISRIAVRVAEIPSVALSQSVAKAFLLDGLELVGIKQRSKLVAGVWSDLESLVPGATSLEQVAMDGHLLPEDQLAARILFWGAVIRLCTIEGEPPEGTAEFLDWCGYSVHQSHSERKATRHWENFLRSMKGEPGVADDRRTLNLPPEAELTRKGVNDAYRALARKHHPDVGGTAEQMHRLTEARDRLLLTLSQ